MGPFNEVRGRSLGRCGRQNKGSLKMSKSAFLELGNVTFQDAKEVVDVIKRMDLQLAGLSWIIWVGPRY